MGVSRLFGIELLKNFNYPYFSRDIAEFWRRWHISLSSWFRDYLYIPLGGSRGGIWAKIRNILIIFAVSGFWHGANWTFIVWGLINALLIMPSIIFGTNRNNVNIVAEDKLLPNLKEFVQIITTFFLTCFAWIFFRAKDLSDAFYYISKIFSKKLFAIPKFNSSDLSVKTLAILLFLFVLIEWLGRSKNHALEIKGAMPGYLRMAFYFIVFMAIMIWGVTAKTEFIYFAF